MIRQTKKRGKSSFLYLVFILLVTFLTGCGTKKEQSTLASEIELIEPVNALAEYEEVACRNLYKVKVYSSAVFPRVEEYSFNDTVTFSKFAVYPGETVKKGRALAYSDTSSLEKQIEDMEKTISKMQEEFAEYREETSKAIAKPKSEIENLKNIVEAYLKVEPAPEELGYEQWQKEFLNFEGQYRILAHNTDTLRLQLEQKTQLYELDYARNIEVLEAMKKKLVDNHIYAKASGESVAIAMVGAGDRVSDETSLVAVGNSKEKILKCQYINQSVVSSAQEIYALINGVRYEVIYEPIDAESYSELTARGETVYTSFILEDVGDEVQIGDFAVVVIVEKRCEEALSVPKEAIHKDEQGYYVYVLKENESIYVPIKTGMSDGVYTQILSGLELKDKVMLGEVKSHGQQTTIVETGSFHSEFKGSGYMMYPSTVMVKNPVEYGTVYFVEQKVALYQQVEAGEVLVEIRVQPDEIALQQQKRKLSRLEERLKDMEKESSEETEKEIQRKKEEIEEVKTLIADMEKDGAVTKIRAKSSGVVIGFKEHEAEDILAKEEVLIEIANENICYVVVENTNQQLNYGNKATISYQDLKGSEKKAEGIVSNISGAGVSKNLRTDYSMILLPSDVVGEMAVTTQGREGWWSRNLFAVTAKVRTMDNVLVVPKKAVKEINGNTYVYVMEEDGSVTARSFVAGGYNETGYWVIEGLTEGMKVCLE